MPTRVWLTCALLPPRHLKADPQPVPRRLGEAVERAGRGVAAAAFKTRDGALRGVHAARKLGLAQARAQARLGDRRHEREFLLQRVVFLAHLRVLQQPRFQVLELCHLTSFARCRARSSSRAGVFCVFLTNTLTTITRRPTAVT